MRFMTLAMIIYIHPAIVLISCSYKFDENHLVQPVTQIVNAEKSSSTFTIKKLTSPLEIVCNAVNSAGTASASLIVLSNTPPIINSFDLGLKNQVNCNVTGFPFPDVFIQTPNGTEIEGTYI